MAQYSRTWWGQKFITAIESFSDSERIKRGRSYSTDSRILSFEIKNGVVKATIRGNINPYFGILKEPKYKTEVKISQISAHDWTEIVQLMSCRASVVGRLLLNEVPEKLELIFKVVGHSLLPKNYKDFESSCSCPDYSNPCKHVVGVIYRLASELDQNPFLLFELRGLSKEDLQKQLAASSLGKILATELGDRSLELIPTTSYFPQPKTTASPEVPTLKDFWQGQKRLPTTIPLLPSSSVSAIVIKKQGDNPPFWRKDSSFIETMEELYDRVRTKNSGLL